MDEYAYEDYDGDDDPPDSGEDAFGEGLEDAQTVDARYPDVRVQLTGRDGNALSIIANVGVALRRAGHRDAEEAWKREAFASKSYDDLLVLAIRWVDVR